MRRTREIGQRLGIRDAIVVAILGTGFTWALMHTGYEDRSARQAEAGPIEVHDATWGYRFVWAGMALVAPASDLAPVPVVGYPTSEWRDWASKLDAGEAVALLHPSITEGRGVVWRLDRGQGELRHGHDQHGRVGDVPRPPRSGSQGSHHGEPAHRGRRGPGGSSSCRAEDGTRAGGVRSWPERLLTTAQNQSRRIE